MMAFRIQRFLFRQTGATAIEYAFIASMISVAIAAVVFLIGGDLSAAYQRVADMF